VNSATVIFFVKEDLILILPFLFPAFVATTIIWLIILEKYAGLEAVKNRVKQELTYYRSANPSFDLANFHQTCIHLLPFGV